MRYFIINEYLGNPANKFSGLIFSSESKTRRVKHEKIKLGITKLRTYKKMGSLYKWKHSKTKCKFLLKAKNLEAAYIIGSTFRNVVEVFCDLKWDINYIFEKLIEFTQVPPAQKGINALVNKYKYRNAFDFDKTLLQDELQSGTVIDNFRLNYALNIQEKVLEKNLAFALESLNLSCSLSGGYMVSSYFEHHYLNERKEETTDLRKKQYFENKMKYDSAYLLAFRAIEYILGKGNLKKDNIDKKLIEFKMKYEIKEEKKYEAHHLKILKQKFLWKNNEIIQMFLIKRNAVAAHGNILPYRLMLTKDDVFEIQRFCKHLLVLIIKPLKWENGPSLKELESKW